MSRSAAFNRGDRSSRYEHSEAMSEASEAVAALRKSIKRLRFISGGEGYNNMGKRELEQARSRADEASFWISAAASAMNAGAKRAVALGYPTADEDAA